jgi:hypothetical protein
MTKTSRSSCVMATRVPCETRTRLAALAARRQLCVSQLLAELIDQALSDISQEPDPRDGPLGAGDSSVGGVSSDRITLRLREGDHSLAAERARARGMKTGSYLGMLIHNHVRDAAVLPSIELDQIRVTCARLAALGRQLGMFGMPNTQAEPWTCDLGDVIAQVRREVEAAREATAAVVRRNLVSWEAGGERGHA